MRDLLTRSTIWITIVSYTIGVVLFALRGRPGNFDARVRSLWTVTVIALAAHFVCAFQFFHAWSHTAAYVETARQTEEVFRINWGGGLFINYALLSIWTFDVGWWWIRGVNSYRQRQPWWVVLLWHGVVIFILFNATVVFKDGLVRWLGLLICLTLIIAWVSINKRRTPSFSSS